ncbi:MAG: glycosyltransferase [Desulfobacteraceae bacterium]|nr:glycosyltransferase [Desulfobacteraceae bacterium]
MKRAVHQYTTTIEPGDGVSNSVFLIQRFLLELGYDSNIYSGRIHPDLAGSVLSPSGYDDSGEGILLIHHALAQPEAPWLFSLRDLKAMVYHNITPPHYFSGGSELQGEAGLARRQLAEWAGRFAGSIAISEYNRRELLSLGYGNIHTIPLVVDMEKMGTVIPDQEIVLKHEGTFNLVYVGRIMENKCQHDLIHAFAGLKEENARLFCIGGVSSPAYECYLRELIARRQLRDRVILTGKVSDEALWGYYRAADMFVCLSDHEGFGIPLIEASLANVPVVAYDSSNIGNTLGGSGFLLSHKNSRDVSNIWHQLMEQPEWRHALVKSQQKNLQRFSPEALKNQLSAFLSSLGLPPVSLPGKPVKSLPGKARTIRMEGPFDSSYSLALVNRKLAEAFKKMKADVELYATEGGGDYAPDQEFLAAHPRIKDLWNSGPDPRPVDMVIRNLYPPRVTRMNGERRVLGPYGWEESAFPGGWAAGFNRHLHLITTMSEFVTKALQDNGVTVPMATVGIGADHLLDVAEEPLPLTFPQGYTLLHISSSFPRKGVDLLLSAFPAAYDDDFKATLIIKTFPNPHNTVRKQLFEAGWRMGSGFEFVLPGYRNKTIILLEDELSPGQLVTLYRHSDLLLAPGRGEGFGLPMAEAMVFNLPVLTTALGGQADFCTPETAWLIGCSFSRAGTHMGLSDSVWFEPDLDDLIRKMALMAKLSRHEIERKTVPARANILGHYSWDRVAQRMVEAVDGLDNRSFPRCNPRVGWVTTWNTPCGIASYSEMLTRSFPRDSLCILANRIPGTLEPDGGNVIRCWEAGGDDTLETLLETIRGQKLTEIVIQFNFSFFNLDALNNLITALGEQGVATYLFLHSTADVKPPHEPKSLASIDRALKLSRRVFVHSVHDLNRLKGFGIVRNSTLFPHGVPGRNVVSGPSGQSPSLIATFGFLLPHKGTRDLIRAFELLRETGMESKLLLLTALYPGGISENECSLCRSMIEKSPFRDDITMVTGYLGEEEIHQRLSRADVIVYPYQNTQESSSAAVRTGLATGRPVATTPLAIFEDVSDVVYTLPGGSPRELARGIKNLMNDSNLKEKMGTRQQAWLSTHNWRILGQRLQNIISSNLRIFQ